MLPQILWIVIMALLFGLNVAQHGKPKTGNENAWITLIAVIIQVGLLLWGGFFSV